tara:strand:+ start:1737 stop:2213 length:477 start_codon:yes stop_codon:yes gene_type:complete
MTGILKVDQIQNNTGTTAMTINSDGYVNLPQAIAFMARKTDASTHTAGGNITFNTTVTSHSGWNGTTFTCPIAGKYRFYMGAHMQSMSNSGFEIGIAKGGTVVISGYAYNSTATRERTSCEAIISCNVGDAITFRLIQGDLYAGTGTGGVSCTGHLLG